VGSFVSMNALRPFQPHEITSLGGDTAFISPAWQSSLVYGRPEVWAIPLFVEARVIYYWRDLLEKNGIDERTAFQTPEQIEATFQRLQQAGFQTPWAIATGDISNTLYLSASWVWAKGGDFVSADGARPLFHLPEARAGLRAYFNLHRYMPPTDGLITGYQAAELFLERRVAATMTGPWCLNLIRQKLTPTEAAQIGLALPPGPPFVGGTNLIIWRHSEEEELAVALVRHLSTQTPEPDYCLRVGFLPVRLAALAEPPYSTDPRYQVIIEAIQRGRPFPFIPRWGLVEERLTSTFTEIWASLQANPEQDLDALLTRHLELLGKRLEMTLAR